MLCMFDFTYNLEMHLKITLSTLIFQWFGDERHPSAEYSPGRAGDRPQHDM